MRKWIAMAAAVLMVAAAGTAMAATTDVQVTAQVAGTCVFSTPPSFNFGLLDQASTSDAVLNGNLQFWCTNGVAYTLSDQANVGTADGAYSGNLSDGAGHDIGYNIGYDNYQGTGAGPSSPLVSSLTVTIPNGNYVGAVPGTYSETVTFTITP